MTKVDIGPGHQPKKGFISLGSNAKDYHVDHIFTWGRDKIPLDNESVDYVHSSHCIEHIEWNRVPYALREVHRILKPGGHCDIWTINFESLVRAFAKGEAPDKWMPKTSPPVPEGADGVMWWINARLFCYAKDGDEGHLHHSVYTPQHLRQCMRLAGFDRCRVLKDSERIDAPHHNVNMGVRGVKN